MQIQTNPVGTANRPVKSLSAKHFSRFVRSKDKSKPVHARTATTQILTAGEQGVEVTLTRKQVDLMNKTTRVISKVKGRESLQEENIDLKTRLNCLQQQLTCEKTQRRQLNRQKTNSHTIELDSHTLNPSQNQPQSQSQHARLVEGLRYQYRKMKEMYEEKCGQCEEVAKDFEVSRTAQFRIYCQAIEKENRSLVRKLQLYQLNQDSKSALEQMAKTLSQCQAEYGELLLKKQAQSVKMKECKAKLKVVSGKVSQLEEEVRRKDNQLHQLRRSGKKLETENAAIKLQNAGLLKKVQSEVQAQADQLQRIMKRQSKRLEVERNLFYRSLAEKQAQIDELAAENKHITAMLVAPRSEQDFNGSEKIWENSGNARSHYNHSPLNSRVGSHLEPDSPQLALNRSRRKTRIDHETKPDEKNITAEQLIRLVRSDEEEMGRSVDSTIKVKVVRSSRFKHSQDCRQRKRVKLAQLTFRSELVFKMIVHGISVEAAKGFFDGADPLVTTKEVQQILQKHPFDLKPSQAELLARYMVEDSSQEVVYYHADNQVQRAMAKSIVKAVLGEYTLPDSDYCRESWSGIIGKYGRNMQSALSSLAQTGKADGSRIFDIFESIHVLVEQQLRDWLVSRLFYLSKNLAQLDYLPMFDPQWIQSRIGSS